MEERRKSRRSSAKACIDALSGIAKELRSDNEFSGFDLGESSVGFQPDSSKSSESEGSLSEDVPSEELDVDDDDGINSDETNSSLASMQRRSLKAKKGAELSIHNLTSSSCAPIVKYMVSCRIRQLKSIKATSVWYFKQALDNLRAIFDTKFHPFTFYPSYYREEFEARQIALFPKNLSYTPYSLDDPLHCIPGPATSPIYSCQKNPSQYKQLNIFEFDRENNMFYVGGLVQAISWSPPRNRPKSEIAPGDDDSNQPDTVYLAITTLPSPDTRVFYTDPVSTHSGLIQVWCCGQLGLKNQPPDWSPLPHFFMAHEWGHVLDLCWLPISVEMVHPKNELPADQFRMADARILFNPFPQSDRIAGHLIAACQDGQVRIFAVPRFALDPWLFTTQRRLPLFYPRDAFTVKLSACPDEIPPWLGWPTILHVRPEFPERLFVGYSSGYVAFYDLSNLNSLFYTASKNHLAPVKLFRLVNGPVVSLALNPLNGRYLIVRGLDLRFAIWDMEDTPTLNLASPEISWNMIHGLPGRHILWPARGDVVFYSRECAFSRKSFSDGRGTPLLDMNEISARGDSFVQQTYIDAPHECTRHLIPLGIQSVSSMDFSDPLNALLCASDRGRLELVLNSLDGRVKQCTRNKFTPQLRIPLCQWTFEEISPEPEQKVNASQRKAIKHALLSHIKPDPDAEPITENLTTTDSCAECSVERAFCSHKLRAQYRLRLHTEKNIPLKPFLDFLKTPYLSITQARFCQDPGSATWLAAGTMLGFVQLIRSEYLYLRRFDKLLNRTPDDRESPYLSLDTVPADRGPRSVNKARGLADTASLPPSKPKVRGPARASRYSKQQDGFCPGRSIMFFLKNKQAKRRNATSPNDVVVTSSSEEATSETSNAEPLRAVTVRRRRSAAAALGNRRRKPNMRSVSSSSLSSLSDADSDRTEPCMLSSP